MPNTPRPRKVKKILKKIFKGKSADKGLQELSDENYQPGKTPPNRTPQTDVMGNTKKEAKSGVPQSQKKGTPAMADSEGKPMTPGQQRRAIKKVKKAEKKAKKKEEKEKRKASRPNKTPQNPMIFPVGSKTSTEQVKQGDKKKVDPANLGIPPVPKGFNPSKKLPSSTPRPKK